jgi:broad specificity phosphatase PhoE
VSRRVLLLRHGRTEWNRERRFQGQADPPLDEVGQAQAYEVALIIAALRPGLLVSSDLQRASQTAEIVGRSSALPVILDARLRERGLGHWEGLTRDDVERDFPDEYAVWVSGADVAKRGGESRDEVAARALAAFEELPAVPVTVLVTHSATAMALTNALLGIPQAVHPLGPLANCHWTELYDEARGGGAGARWRLRGHNLGAPGTIIPAPLHAGEDADAADADA